MNFLRFFYKIITFISLVGLTGAIQANTTCVYTNNTGYPMNAKAEMQKLMTVTAKR